MTHGASDSRCIFARATGRARFKTDGCLEGAQSARNTLYVGARLDDDTLRGESAGTEARRTVTGRDRVGRTRQASFQANCVGISTSSTDCTSDTIPSEANRTVIVQVNNGNAVSCETMINKIGTGHGKDDTKRDIAIDDKIIHTQNSHSLSK
jgi:hypothetical protein